MVMLNNFGFFAMNAMKVCKNSALPKPDQIHLLTQIRRATIKDQEAVLNWLLQKFGLEAKQKIERGK
jgi:hypothetical protein